MKRILVVDDAVFMREALKLMLKKNGFTVAGEADDGINAVMKYMELKPDIVTMDITMPRMDGIQALKKIKELDPGSKVLMISAMGQENMVREAVLAGAKGFIVKPFNEEFVIEALKKL